MVLISDVNTAALFQCHAIVANEPEETVAAAKSYDPYTGIKHLGHASGPTRFYHKGQPTHGFEYF